MRQGAKGAFKARRPAKTQARCFCLIVVGAPLALDLKGMLLAKRAFLGIAMALHEPLKWTLEPVDLQGRLYMFMLGPDLAKLDAITGQANLAELGVPRRLCSDPAGIHAIEEPSNLSKSGRYLYRR